MSDHLIGLLLGAEEDWPRAFETIQKMVGPITHDGAEHTVSSERLTIEPFRLDAPVRTAELVVMALAPGGARSGTPPARRGATKVSLLSL